MSLLEPSAEDKEAAAKFLGSVSEDADNEPADTDSDKTPSETIPDEVAKSAQREGDSEETEPTDEDSKPTGLEKRIAQLTKQRRDAERELAVLKARDAQRDREFQEMKSQIASFTAKPEPQLSEDASPEEISAFYTDRLERERREMEQRLQRQIAEQQVNTLIAVQEMKHDGADGKPSFADLRKHYEELITLDPRYEHTRNTIQSASNPPAKFYELALDMWRQDHKEEFDEQDMLARERDAATVATGGSGTRSRGNGRSKLSDSEKKTLKTWFGDTLDMERLEKRRGAN